MLGFWFGTPGHRWHLRWICIQTRRPKLAIQGPQRLQRKFIRFLRIICTIVRYGLLAIIDRVSYRLVFFNCSSQFSVPKWKTMSSQSEILFYEILNVQGAFLTVPPKFQCKKEKPCSTNEDLLNIENFMEQNLWLAVHRFSFWYWKLGGTVKKITLYNRSSLFEQRFSF